MQRIGTLPTTAYTPPAFHCLHPTTMPITVLPLEVLTAILAYLPTTVHLPLQYQLVCHQWHDCKEPVRQSKLHDVEQRIAAGHFGWKLVPAGQPNRQVHLNSIPPPSQPIAIVNHAVAQHISRSTIFNPSPPPSDSSLLSPQQSPGTTPTDSLFQRSRPVNIRQNPQSTAFISSFFHSRYYSPASTNSHPLARSHHVQSANSINDEYEANVSVTDDGSNAYMLTEPTPTSISSVSQLTKLLNSLSESAKVDEQQQQQPAVVSMHAQPLYNHLETLQAHATLLDIAPALHAHTACAVSQHLVYTFAGSSRMYDIRGDSSLFAYHTQHNQWYRVHTTGDQPTPRTFAPLVYVPQQHCLLTFGGQNRDLEGKWSFFNDIYLCDLYTYRWTKVVCAQQSQPCARVGHRMSVVGDTAYIYGGTYCTVPAVPVAGANQPLLGAAAPAYIYLNDFWSLHLRTFTWKQHQLVPDNQSPAHLPQACHSYEMCHLPYVDPVTQQPLPHLLLYGGNADVYSAKNLNDVYIIDLSTSVCRKLKLTCLVPQYSSDSHDADIEAQSTSDAHLMSVDDVESPTNAAVSTQQPSLPVSVLTSYHSKPHLPSARWCANLTVVGTHVVLCGGYRSRTTPSDFSLKHVYTLDWQQMLSHNYQHQTLVQPTVPVLHSAEVLAAAPLRSPSLASMYDGYWLRRTSTSSSKIPARTFSCMVCVGELDVVLIGGAIRGTPVNEVLRLL